MKYTKYSLKIQERNHVCPLPHPPNRAFFIDYTGQKGYNYGKDNICFCKIC